VKEAELRELATCCVCHQKILASGVPLFWRVTVERFGVDLAAVRRQDGLAQFVGSSAVAEAIGPGEEMTVPISRVVVAVCEKCCTENVCVAQLAEAGRQGE
jgi:hypothetical protein